MKKRIITALLICAMLLPSLAACSQSTENADETTPQSTTTTSADAATETTPPEEDPDEEVVTDDLPERDFEGFAYNIYTRSNTTHYQMLAEEMTGEVLNDSIYERNLAVADRFNVVFSETEYSDEGLAATNVQSGDQTFSLMNVRCTAADNMAQKGYCFNISELQYIDLSKPYWDDDLTKMIGIGDKEYTAIGFSNLTAIDFMTVLLFNKNLHDQYQLDSIYELVREGKWTFDRFGEMSAAAILDLDGDGVMNQNDQWGQLGVAKYHQTSLFPAAGAMYITKDANNVPVYSLPSDEFFVDVMNKIFAVCNDNNAWYVTTDESNEGTQYHTMFRNNQGLFLSTLFYYIESLRDMEYDFGIVPYPKYEESQSEYYSRISFFDTSVIPVTVPDVDCSTIILEALTCESFNNVIPAYKDIALKSKFARDEDSSQMIDLIWAHRIIDFGDSYFAGTIRDGFVNKMFYEDNRDVVSQAKSREKALNKTIERMIENYGVGQ